MTGVCIGVMTAGSVDMACAESLIGTVTTKRASWIFFHKSPPYLDDGRNMVVTAFLDDTFADCDKLLMVDSDIEFRPEDVTTLAAHNLPIVSGVYWSQFATGVHPIVYGWDKTETGLDTMSPLNDLPDDIGLFKADGVGAGFLMIDREVIDKFAIAYDPPCQWFHEPIVGGVHFGEDLGFALRCAEQGYEIMVDTAVQVAHHKSARIGGK